MFKLPDYTYTKDFKLFKQEWEKVLEPFIKMGFTVHGFNPDILMSKDGNRNTFNLPLYAAEIIIKNLKELP